MAYSTPSVSMSSSSSTGSGSSNFFESIFEYRSWRLRFLKERFTEFKNQSESKTFIPMEKRSDWAPTFILDEVKNLLKRCQEEKEFEGRSELILSLQAFQIKLKKNLTRAKF